LSEVISGIVDLSSGFDVRFSWRTGLESESTENIGIRLTVSSQGAPGSLSFLKQGLNGTSRAAVSVASGISEIKNSTRLFNWRPSRVLFVAKGCCFPIGTIWMYLPAAPAA